MPTEDGERHAVFKLPKGELTLPRPKKQLPEAQREARKQAAAKMRPAWLTDQDRRYD